MKVPRADQAPTSAKGGAELAVLGTLLLTVPDSALLSAVPPSRGGPGIRLQVGHGLLKGRTKEVPKVTTGNCAVADHDELALKRLLLKVSRMEIGAKTAPQDFEAPYVSPATSRVPAGQAVGMQQLSPNMSRFCPSGNRTSISDAAKRASIVS